ncbi:MAG: glycan-binding surface protein [Ferruginibacter sp.]
MSQHRTNKILILLLISGCFLTMLSCKKDNNTAQPAITQIRAIAPAPNDSILKKAGPGEWVVIQGTNLADASQIFFNGYPASFNSALFAGNNLVVLIPADMPFATLAAADLNTVKVITPGGTVVYQFPIVPPPPVVATMSNEYAVAGTRVSITGNNFFYIDKVIFPGGIAATTNIVSNSTGTSLDVTIPAGVNTGGTIQVVNRYGTGTSVLLFNDFTTGVLHNYDNVSNYDWGAGNSNNSGNYPGNRGYYGVMTASGVSAGDFGWWNGNRPINLKSAQWVAATDLSKPLGNYAVKFEINVIKPWKNGSLFIMKDYNWTYVARYEPWQKMDGTVADFTTTGWQTVTIPLDIFKTKANNQDGTGVPAASMSALLGSGSGGFNMFFVNPGTTAVADFEAAVDNIRVEKIAN